jgi:hypothetical protein
MATKKRLQNPRIEGRQQELHGLLAGWVASTSLRNSLSFGSAPIFATLGVLIDTDQNPLDRTAAGSTFVCLELTGQIVEEARFQKSLTMYRQER